MFLIVDLDGVVYRGSVPIAGVPGLLRRRVAGGDVVVYATNNSSRHGDEYEAFLRHIGAPVSEGRIVTSARAAAHRLAGADPPVRVALVFGGPGLRRELRDVGIRVVAPTAHGVAQRPQAVVVGIDRGLTYERLTYAARAVWAGARFIAANRDPVYPAADGPMPGAGAVVAALEMATARAPEVVGKPEPGLFEEAARVAGVDASTAVVIGDSLATDIAAAHRIGARSVLMLTGVTGRAELERASSEARPTVVAADAAELEAALERLARDA